MIFKMIGITVQKQQLDEALAEVGLEGGESKFDFPIFCAVAAKFMIEEDEEQMREELKEAFRIYDKVSNTDKLMMTLGTWQINPQANLIHNYLCSTVVCWYVYVLL